MNAAQRINKASRLVADAETCVRDGQAAYHAAVFQCDRNGTVDDYAFVQRRAHYVVEAMRTAAFHRADLERIKTLVHNEVIA